ncbi:hypothetical protein ACWGR4_38870 [Embleya sp. NPDC055664]
MNARSDADESPDAKPGKRTAPEAAIGEDEPPDRLSAESKGRGAIAIAQVMGNVIVSIFADDSRRWRLPPFCVVIALVTTALLRNPGGPEDQFTGIHVLMGIALLATVLRALALVGSERGRVSITVVSLICVMAAFVWTEYLRVHGEVDVTGRVEVAHAMSVPDGGRVYIKVKGAPGRTHLRLTLAVRDADERAQACVPQTRLDLLLTGPGRPVAVDGIPGGTTVDLALGGSRSTVEATMTVHTDPGCAMNVSVATAILHD